MKIIITLIIALIVMGCTDNRSENISIIRPNITAHYTVNEKLDEGRGNIKIKIRNDSDVKIMVSDKISAYGFTYNDNGVINLSGGNAEDIHDFNVEILPGQSISIEFNVGNKNVKALSSIRILAVINKVLIDVLALKK